MMGVPPSFLMGVTPSFPRGVPPSQVWIWGVPPSQVWMWGYPLPRSGWGTSSQVWMLGVTPSQVRLGIPPISIYFLHGGWYAFCVHTGGLSCFCCVLTGRIYFVNHSVEYANSKTNFVVKYLFHTKLT